MLIACSQRYWRLQLLPQARVHLSVGLSIQSGSQHRITSEHSSVLSESVAESPRLPIQMFVRFLQLICIFRGTLCIYWFCWRLPSSTQRGVLTRLQNTQSILGLCLRRSWIYWWGLRIVRGPDQRARWYQKTAAFSRLRASPSVWWCCRASDRACSHCYFACPRALTGIAWPASPWFSPEEGRGSRAGSRTRNATSLLNWKSHSSRVAIWEASDWAQSGN